MRVLLLPNAKYLANVYITHTVLPRMRKQACKLLIVQDEKSTDCGGMEEGIVVLCGHSCVCINSWYSWLGARLKSLLLPTLSQNNRNLCIKVKPRAQTSRSDILFIHFWPRIQAFSVVPMYNILLPWQDGFLCGDSNYFWGQWWSTQGEQESIFRCMSEKNWSARHNCFN